MDTVPFGVVSPQDWGLKPAPPEALSADPVPELGMSLRDLDARARAALTQWLPRQYDRRTGALFGHYDASHRRQEPPNTVNLIGPWLHLAAWDRGRTSRDLARARSAAEWFARTYVVGHPMSVVVGGVRDTGRPHELWTKYAAEQVILNLALERRADKAPYRERAVQGATFLRQSHRHGFAPRYDERAGAWLDKGWQSFGRSVEALLLMERASGDPSWGAEALAWGEYGRSLLQADGGLYLLDGEYYNSDIAADEIRAFCFLHERTGRADFLDAAVGFGRWHLAHRRPDGAWPVNIDREGRAIANITGPGDMSNLAIAFLRLARVDIAGRAAWREAALGALGYAYRQQAAPGSGHPYLRDPRVRWGFWSWDPYFDYTLSADQCTHHVRAAWFVIDALHGGLLDE